MQSRNPILVFGPAYLDIVLEIDAPLAPPHLLDQSLPASRSVARDDGTIRLTGANGDRLVFSLPAGQTEAAAEYHLSEPVLARLLGKQAPTVVGEYPVQRFVGQLGGMGAGYAKAFGGTLRFPLGCTDGTPDAVGRTVLDELTKYDIHAQPSLLPECASDSSLVILSAGGDKLAVGVREAMVRWRVTAEDHALIAEAGALVFCGAPNTMVAEVLAGQPGIPVMCAPAMRNMGDRETPLADLAPYIHYLTLNALEWAHLDGRERLRETVPVITVTDGPHGSRVYFKDGEIFIPAIPRTEPANTNRAGETYGSTFFKVLLHEKPDFPCTGIDATLAEYAARIATQQASRQLDIAGFEFPPDDWMDEVNRDAHLCGPHPCPPPLRQGRG